MKFLNAITQLITAISLLGCAGASKNQALSDQTAQSQLPPIPSIHSEIKSGLLSGLYLSAGQNSPVILIVPGSGPTDRDGNSPLGVNGNTYRYLAEQLFEKGISSVRVDKRGMFSSAEAGDPDQVTVAQYAQDYRQWVETIKLKTNNQCVYMLGHSEGALMVSAASIGREDICGLILVAAPGRPIGDIMREQLQNNPANAPLLSQAFETIESLEAGKKVNTSSLHPALAGLFNAQVQGFLISVFALSPSEVAAKANVQTLIIQGSTDLQTSILDAEILAEKTGGELVIIEGVNHLLKEAPSDPAQNLATYNAPDLPVSSKVTDAIVAFIMQ